MNTVDRWGKWKSAADIEHSDEGAESRLKPYLDPDERLLWTGHPPKGLVLRPSDVQHLPIGLVWTGGVIFLTWSAVEARWVEILFILFGLYMVAGRFVIDAWRRRRMTYALTSRRALILCGDRLSSMPITPDLAVTVSGQEIGSVAFGPDYVPGIRRYDRRATQMPSNPFVRERDDFAPNLYRLVHEQLRIGPSHPFIFERVDAAPTVYRLVRDIQYHLRESRPDA